VFIEKVCQGEALTVHGDGLQKRSFSYVGDTVDGIVRCVENSAANNQVFNIGNPREMTVLDFAKLVSKSILPNDEPKIEFVPYAAFNKYEDVRRRVPDISKIQKMLGYTPKVSVEEGLKHTIAWQRPFYNAVKGQ
jgi:UDP-glucose 4-epimerase